MFENEDITHIEGDINPVRDLSIIEEELRLKDIEYINKEFEKIEKLAVRGGDRKLIPLYDCFVKLKKLLIEDKRSVRFGDWNANEVRKLFDFFFENLNV